MIFHINNNVLFNENECTLAHIDNAATKIVLPKPSARLLSLFIRNNNVLLLRDKLLNDVWIDHGLKASNNNLNNYVSGLRKSLAQFGEEELIVTYPRQGFKFIASIIHEVNIDKRNIRKSSSDDNVKGNMYENAKNKKNKIRWSLRRLAMIISTSLALFSAIVIYQNSTRVSMYPLGNYERCQIYSMNYGDRDLAKVKQIIRQAGFSCRDKSDIYYYDNIRDEVTQEDTELLTFCPREINSPCTYNYIDKK
ncbi:winged helix-turn-helix domain-containing protein [Serratia marcescens]|uniref:winged helix-turn-helix domain-containing protein n=1 Tax=Serratia marcescens TaxID=615 RepID=UPI0018D947B5|nr:winged helix-turn-helix domain-containing protein [Serratia marcescens]MBH3276410.1 winged helix-turn-helix domain-containing protein [Serratia marcescens]HEJ9150387.1 winged helix-turn-helix domain-containing protein [Serratia marcescens]